MCVGERPDNICKVLHGTVLVHASRANNLACHVSILPSRVLVSSHMHAAGFVNRFVLGFEGLRKTVLSKLHAISHHMRLSSQDRVLFHNIESKKQKSFTLITTFLQQSSLDR